MHGVVLRGLGLGPGCSPKKVDPPGGTTGRVGCGTGWMRRPCRTQDLHESGAVGDATKASAEKGEQLLDHGARAFCELLDDVDKFDPELFRRRPKA